MQVDDREGDHDRPAPHAPPRTVRFAVLVLALQGLSSLLAPVPDLAAGAPPTAEVYFEAAVGVGISALLGWFLWRGSNVARWWAIVLTALTVLFFVAIGAATAAQPFDFFVVWLLADLMLAAVLLVALLRPDTRRWCRYGPRAQPRVGR